MRLKKGVRITGVRPETVLGMHTCDSVFQKHGIEMVVTSVMEGSHSRASLHYPGCAFDLRNRNVPQELRNEITLELQEALQDDFDVIAEGNHWHVEFQPKTGVNL